MPLFFAFLGLLLGLYLGCLENIWGAIISFSVGLLFFPLVYKRGAVVPFLTSLLGGILLSLLRFLPCATSTSFQGIVIESKDNYFIFLSGFSKYYVGKSGHSFEVGDILNIEGSAGSFSFTSYESRFDFAKYLSSNGIFYQISSKKIEAIWTVPLRLRSWEDSFLSKFNDEAKSLLASLLFNRKDSSSKVISQASSLSLLSLYSSSGIFYSLLLRGVERLLSPSFSKKGRNIISLMLATLILPFSLWKIGIWRVYISKLIRFFNEFFFDKRLSSLDATCLSGLLLLSINFYFAYQTGFLLGYAISFILYFSRSLIARMKWRWRPFASTGLIHLTILPSHIYSSNGIHFLSIIYSLVSIPLVFPFLLLGWLSFFTLPFTSLLNGYGSFLGKVLSLFSYIDLFLPFPSLHPVWAFLYYLLLVCSLYFLEIGGHLFYKIASISLLVSYSFCLLPLPSLVTDQVSFINVGQGDAILIRDNFTSVLIDTGGNLSFDMGKEVLIPYLRKERIYHIDCLIASHGDFDHIGAKESLMRNFNVKRFVEKADEFPLTIGNLSFTNYNTYGETEENESSLVLGLSFMDKYWLFTGDAPISIEKRIIEDNPNLDCDILKVGHHGSDTSTSLKFIEAITPIEAVISVGANNKYGHPKDSVLKTLRSKKIKIRRTDLEGTITYRKISLS